MTETGIKPEVLNEIRGLAQKHRIQSLVLFGSRARGDYHRTSDIDLAATGGNIAEFTLDLDEYTSTLLEYDVVDMDKPVQAELRESIRNEGKIIYEKV